MKVSIVIAILDSHEIVLRQILHFEKMNLPDDVEIIFVDDGSEPPLTYPKECKLRHFHIYPTYDYRPWTQPIARNKGVELASGEYVICTDIDHIISRDLIETVRNSSYDVIHFKREVGVLDENGDFSQDMETLDKWGFLKRRLRLPAHGNSYAIKRELFLRIGGSQQKAKYPNRDEIPIKRGVRRLLAKGEITVIPDEDRPTIYMFPNGRFCGDKNFNPFGYFHNLIRA